MPVSEGYHSLCFQTFNFLPNVWWVCVLRCRVVKGHVSFCFWIVCLCPLSVFLWGTWSFAYLFLKALYILESLALCNEWQIFFPHVVGLHFDRFFFFLFFWLCRVACGIFIPWPGFEPVWPSFRETFFLACLWGEDSADPLEYPKSVLSKRSFCRGRNAVSSRVAASHVCHWATA